MSNLDDTRTTDTKPGPAEKMYDVLHHRQYVKTMYADAALVEKDARISELKAELEMAYENADFDEPLTFEEYRADLREQAAARAQYEAERKAT